MIKNIVLMLLGIAILSVIVNIINYSSEESNSSNFGSSSVYEEYDNETYQSDYIDKTDETAEEDIVYDNTYIIEDSNSRYLTMSELSSYSDSQLPYIRNEIFARHGYIFTNEKYREYFKNKSWYVQDSNFKGNTEELNIYEKENIKLIQALEDSRKKDVDYLYKDYESVNVYNSSEYYIVYTEAYTNKSNAQNYCDYLDRKAISSQIIEEDNLYKVRVGSAYDLATAKQIAEEIKAKNVDTYILGYSDYYDSKLYSLERLIYNGYYSEFEEGYNEFMVELNDKPHFARYKKMLEKLYEEYM